MSYEPGCKRSLPFNLCNNGEWRAVRRDARYSVLSAEAGRLGLIAAGHCRPFPLHCFWILYKLIKGRVRAVVIYYFRKIFRRTQRVALCWKYFDKVFWPCEKKRNVFLLCDQLLKSRSFLLFWKGFGVWVYIRLLGTKDKSSFISTVCFSTRFISIIIYVFLDLRKLKNVQHFKITMNGMRALLVLKHFKTIIILWINPSYLHN